MLGAWSGGLLRAGGSVLFLLAVAASLAHVIVCAASVARGKPALRAARACIVLFALLAVPLAFDPKTGDVFNLTKYTVVEIAAAVLLALWAVDGASALRAPRWRIGVAVPVAALVAWTAVTTALSINPRLSILGSYQSYDGLLSVAGFAILLLAAAEALDSDDLRPACSAAFYGSGGPVILYALLQFHDRYSSSAHRWDWVPWGRATFGNNQIWSTFGNPNHLAGFLVIMLPLGAALILAGRAAWPKLLAAAMLLAAVVELLVTGTRGAEAAVPFAVITFGLVLAPEVKQAIKRLHLPRPILAGTGAVALAGGLAFMKAAGFFHAGAGSTIQQRFELWRTAIRISLQRPIAGIGPDTFRIRFLTAQSPKYARLYGATDIANGPHNTFLNRLADQGVVGLLLFLGFLVLLGASAVGAARRLRATEIASEKNPGPARTTRFLLAGVAAGLVAFVVQATFNLEQIGLSFYLWILAGLLARVAWDAGVPGSLSLRARVAGGGGRTPRPGEQRSREPAGRSARPTVLGAVAIVSVTLAVALSWWLSAPYRADHPYHIGTLLDAHNSHDQATASYRHASSLNPWQPVYFQSDGQALYKTVANAPPGDQNGLQALRQGLVVYRRAVALDGTNSAILDDYAESLIRLGELDPATQPSSLEAAIAVLRRATADNRFQPRTPLLLGIALAEAHRTPEAIGVLDQGLTVTPTNPDLLRWSARLEQQQGDTATAIGRWRDLLKIAKGDQEATQALAHLGTR